MGNILVAAHSGLRWLTLIFLVLAVLNALMKGFGKSADFKPMDKKLGLFALIFTHIQVLIGIVLYFTSAKVASLSGEVMKDSVARFFAMEHPLTMLIAAILITIGYSKAKRAATAQKKFRLTFVFFLLGLILILAMIPWPMQEQYGAGWY